MKIFLVDDYAHAEQLWAPVAKWLVSAFAVGGAVTAGLFFLAQSLS